MKKDPSFVFFADEQAPTNSLLFGGYLMHRQDLDILDDSVAAAKHAVGLPDDAPLKSSPPSDNSAYQAQRSLDPGKRGVLRGHMMEVLSKLNAICFFSMIWKYRAKDTTQTYKWAFENVIQRLAITLDRESQQETLQPYPGLDVVIDWFPEPQRRDEYFSVYNTAYHHGFEFAQNTLPPLKKFGACPCLLVTSCRFSPALQLADYCVGTMGRLLRWAYQIKEDRDDIAAIRRYLEPVTKHLLRVNGKVIGYGLVLPSNAAKRKVQALLAEVSLCGF
jgi:hypothetical protein